MGLHPYLLLGFWTAAADSAGTWSGFSCKPAPPALGVGPRCNRSSSSSAQPSADDGSGRVVILNLPPSVLATTYRVDDSDDAALRSRRGRADSRLPFAVPLAASWLTAVAPGARRGKPLRVRLAPDAPSREPRRAHLCGVRRRLHRHRRYLVAGDRRAVSGPLGCARRHTSAFRVNVTMLRRRRKRYGLGRSGALASIVDGPATEAQR